VYIKKGAQIGATVGIIENIIGYLIAVVRSAPCMYITADGELAQLRMESNITPMIQQSGLSDFIRSVDETNSRKTGKTDKKIEWLGGGYLVPAGARNPNKGRSISVQYSLQDELAGWPMLAGQDGDPKDIFDSRTKAYHLTRKIIGPSTPGIKGQDKIGDLYLRGDQRQYFVPCKHCGHKQPLRWHGINPANGISYGIKWDLDDGQLIPESVRYICSECGGAHSNADKAFMLDPANGAEWVPTARPKDKDIRSYHITGLLSPPEMYPWSAAVQDWLEAWDVVNNRPIDVAKLQTFYNNVLGESFEAKFDKLRSETVYAHRRPYIYGMIPNNYALKHSESEILLLTAGVDVHKHSLRVGVFGWTKHSRCYLIDYFTLDGTTPDGKSETEHRSNSCWQKLEELILVKEYSADDGKRYRIQTTFIDSGFNHDTVVGFCSDFSGGVFPIKGREYPPKSAKVREFFNMDSASGVKGYGITVDVYKERLSNSLKRQWTEGVTQPRYHFNAPENSLDSQLKELTVEYRREKYEKGTKKVLGYEWFRPSGAANELFDVLIYSAAALDLIAYNLCVEYWGFESTDWLKFWEAAQTEQLFFT
jgi:phage terminase large subunit GpA-like protein